MSAQPVVRPRLRVVVVDDQEHMRRMLALALGAGGEFEVAGEAGDGREALDVVARVQPDALLIDLSMPVMDGVETIRELRARGSRLPALVLTSNADHASVARAMEAGADGYVVKGARAADIRAALRDVAAGGAVLAPAVARGVLDDYLGLVEEKRRRDVAVIRTLASAVEKRDGVTGDHINNVAALSSALWRHMTGSAPDEEMVYGFLLHDVGKIGIPDAILLKPAALTDEEYARMKTHVEIGVDLIAPLGFGSVVTDVIRCHHERFDGNGYPRGLRGEQIPLHARMFSIVDAYDAMIADRPYRKGMSVEQALGELRRGAGAQFDPDCVGGFAAMLAAQPHR